MHFDHVIYAVADLESGVRRFAEKWGLQSTGGGEHPEFGTRNAIVPVGPGQFIELMTVADARSRHPLRLALSEWLKSGDGPVALCLRPDDLNAVAERLSTPIVPAERHNPDGEVLHWRLAGVEAALGAERLPFFIDWQGAEHELDLKHADAARAEGIAWVEYGGNAGRLAQWMGEHDDRLRVVAGEAGPSAIGLRHGPNTLVIR